MSKGNSSKKEQSFTKINPKWIIDDLSIKPKIIELLDEYIGENLGDLEPGGYFLDISLKTQHIEEKRDKLDFIKMKAFCPVKDTVKKFKRQLFRRL